jgi:hypothetical protein
MSGSYLLEPTEIEELSEEAKKRLERLYYHCNVRLGGTSIPVHLEDDDYTYAFESAVNLYRTRSSRSINQTFGFIELQPGQAMYQLHERVDVVKKVTRAGAGFGGTGNLGSFESFGAATINSLMRGVAGGPGGVDLATWDFTAQYMETIERLFAREINFAFRNEDQTLILHQTIGAKEWVLLEVSVLKPLTSLLNDHWAYDWLQKYTLGVCKTILGEKYSLFATISGPQGGSVMKGEQLKQAGNEEMTKLEDDLMVWGDSSDIPLPIRG